MKCVKYCTITLILFSFAAKDVQSQISPDKIKFVRQGVRRFIFDSDQSILLASLRPEEVIGMSAMYPVRHYQDEHDKVKVTNSMLSIQSEDASQTSIWFGGFNPFATYSIDLISCVGHGEVGFEFSDNDRKEQFFITIEFMNERIVDAKLKVIKDGRIIVNQSIATNIRNKENINGKLILQMLGSGLVLYFHDEGLPIPIGQSDFNHFIDLRQKQLINTFQSNLYLDMSRGQVIVNRVESTFSTGMGLADIRAITYENGDPLLDQGRLWYTISIRGRALPHHIQGVFSMDPTMFDIKLEGIIVFDRNDGLLRNEISSHIYYDRNLDI